MSSQSSETLAKLSPQVTDMAEVKKSCESPISASENLPAEPRGYKAPRNPKGTNQHTSPPKDLAKFRQSLRSGQSLMASMISAGFPKSVAKQGFRRLPVKFQKVALEEKRARIQLARQFSVEDISDYVTGGLLENTMNGEDRAAKSYELLGKRRDVNMWNADSGGHLVLIQPPTGLMERLAQSLQPIIEGEIVESK